MKTRTYKFGEFTFKSYYKKVGNNYEIGMKCGTNQIFLGNFVFTGEANKYWTYMHKEIINFRNRFWVAKNVSKNWYCNFFGNFLCNTYYTYLEKNFTKYTKTYDRNFHHDMQKWTSLKRNWDSYDRNSFYKRAA